MVKGNVVMYLPGSIFIWHGRQCNLVIQALPQVTQIGICLHADWACHLVIALHILIMASSACKLFTYGKASDQPILICCAFCEHLEQAVSKDQW